MAVNNTVAALISRTETGQDSFGNDVFTTVVSAVPGVFAPGGSSEVVQGQDLVTDVPTLYLPTGTNVAAIDAIIPQAVVDDTGELVLDDAGQPQGDRFEVDGSPDVWPLNPFTGWLPDISIVVRLRRVTG